MYSDGMRYRKYYVPVPLLVPAPAPDGLDRISNDLEVG